MRLHVIFASLLSLAASTAVAGTSGLSHKRLAGESSTDAFVRYAAERAEGPGVDVQDTAGFDTGYGLRQPFAELDPTTVPEWESLDAVKEVFFAIRDLRNLQTPARPAFPRRISWLYPDDGCFARAAMARRQIEDQWGHDVAKIFIFGNLRVDTNNAPGGSVRWAWHVVPIVRVAGVLYVIDPAIEPKGPLSAEEWALRQVQDVEDASFALCKSYSYGPYSRCISAEVSDETNAASDQQSYLNYEWDRIEELNRDPNDELGDHPPWMN